MKLLAIVFLFNIFVNVAMAESELSSNCQFFVNSLPKGYKWGFLPVSEGNKGSNKKISIFYYYSPQALVSKSPIVFVNGGPATNSHDSARALLAKSESKNLPWIFFDQRGTGCSTPFPEIEGGLKRLESWGAYNIAQDMEALKKLLIGQSKKWQVFGHSYGGLVTYWYLIQFPSSVSSAHVYGYSFNDNPIDWVKSKLLYSKVLQDQFFGNDDDKKEVLKEFTALISEDECILFYEKKICGKGLVDQMGLYLLFPSQWHMFDTYLNRMQNFVDRKMGKKEDILLDLARISFRILSQGNADHNLFLSNLDIVPGFTPQEAYTRAYKRLKSEGHAVDSWLINDYRGLMALKDPAPSLVPERIKHQLKMRDLKKSVQRNKSLKMYIYAGGKDGLSPAPTFSELRENLGDKVLYHEFPEADHNAAFSENLIFGNLKSNL